MTEEKVDLTKDKVFMNYWKAHDVAVLALAKVVTEEDIEAVKKINSMEDAINAEIQKLPKHIRAKYLSRMKQWCHEGV